MKFSEHQQQGRRLAILAGLRAAARYRAALQLLRAYCEAVGYTALVDDLNADLVWLADQGLVDLELDEGACTATLTKRGLDVVNGHAIVEGVQRPAPD